MLEWLHCEKHFKSSAKNCPEIMDYFDENEKEGWKQNFNSNKCECIIGGYRKKRECGKKGYAIISMKEIDGEWQNINAIRFGSKV